MIAVVLLLLLPPAVVQGQTYPTRPIRFVVGGAVGGGWDLAARVLAEKLQEDLGQPVIVENKPGADGILAAGLVTRAPADGYTLMPAVSAQMTVNPVVHQNLSYDPLRDFEPVSLVGFYPLVLVVHPAVPAESLKDLVSYARSNPGRLNYGSGSSGFLLATETLRQATEIDIHRVPYRGSAQVVTALLAGDVQMAIIDLAPALPHIKAGKLRPLAVTTAKRIPQLPGLPTMAESGVSGYELVLWLGLFAPAGTPPEVIARLHSAVARAVELPEVRDKLTASGIIPAGSSPQALAERMRQDIRLFSGVAKSARITTD